MTMYYIQNSYIAADRYDTVPSYVSDAVSHIPNTNILTNKVQTVFIPNLQTFSDLSELESSRSFGYDHYIYSKTLYKPIFILNNKFYQN